MMNYSNAERKQLLDLIRYSIEYGLEKNALPRVDPADYPPKFSEKRATFVTLRKDGRLRGCMGTLEAERGLMEDVIQNAQAAAFRDPRFPRLTRSELERIDIHLSVLTPYEILSVDDEADLLRKLRPEIDGIILEEGAKRATFLPSVWESLPGPAEFIRKLKAKAGLPETHWSDRIRIYRYTAESIH